MKKFYVLSILIAVSSLLFTVMPQPSFAASLQDSNSSQKLAAAIPDPGIVGDTSKDDRPTQLKLEGGLTGTLNGIWNETTRVFYLIIGAYAVVVLSLAALRYGTAQGDSKKVAEARASIVQTILGIALMITSLTVVSLIWSVARALT